MQRRYRNRLYHDNFAENPFVYTVINEDGERARCFTRRRHRLMLPVPGKSTTSATVVAVDASKLQHSRIKCAGRRQNLFPHAKFPHLARIYLISVPPYAGQRNIAVKDEAVSVKRKAPAPGDCNIVALTSCTDGRNSQSTGPRAAPRRVARSGPAISLPPANILYAAARSMCTEVF